MPTPSCAAEAPNRSHRRQGRRWWGLRAEAKRRAGRRELGAERAGANVQRDMTRTGTEGLGADKRRTRQRELGAVQGRLTGETTTVVREGGQARTELQLGATKPAAMFAQLPLKSRCASVFFTLQASGFPNSWFRH